MLEYDLNLTYSESLDVIRIRTGINSVFVKRDVMLREISDLICQGMPAVFGSDGELWQMTALSPPDNECDLDESQTVLEDHWGETQ